MDLKEVRVWESPPKNFKTLTLLAFSDVFLQPMDLGVESLYLAFDLSYV